jgi:hypothetical protein
MRASHLFFLCLLVLVRGVAENVKQHPAIWGVREAYPATMPQNGDKSSAQVLSLAAFQIPRQPDTPIARPGTWAQPAAKRPVDMAQLKKESLELTKLADAIPEQIDQVSNGKLPKELLENLKGIEKLSKRIRSEVSP